MDIAQKVQNAVIEASTSNFQNKLTFLYDALELEKELNNENAVWALENIIKNFQIADEKKLPFCDDTGIPHVLIEIGTERNISGELISQIHEGIAMGLNKLPARPMAVKGNDIERIEQNHGLYDEPAMLTPSSFLIDDGKTESTYNRNIKPDTLNIHLALLGGGPEIRANTYRIFHKRSYKIVIDEIINWLKNSLKTLGCTPSIPVIGIGRTHFEANSLMLKGLIYGNLEKQSKIENYINENLNKTNIGPLGLGGKTTVLGSFVNIGPQRASGVRIASSRPCCFVEPRIATIDI
ncbi:fumarate hydratase [Methanobrevibacter sp. OttesenSCG-928-K11]|nr:fumarate hydratase [Methanobrevibacter sp. OttesenSCG-928-K11]MDL2270845.1 fumarate hydratase [Methanobrevibacter sp. OttesenSCG-928-I08]